MAAVTAPIVVVTDLDGTLLDHDTYEAGPAAARVAALQDAGVAVVCCSAKTRTEQQVHRHDLDISGPFVVENGAAVLDDDGPIRVLGLAYPQVRDRLQDAAGRLGVTLHGFGDMDVGEVAERTGLSAAAAQRARQREYTEPFVVLESRLDEASLRAGLHAVGLDLHHGARFWTASGHHDKGDAVTVLRQLFRTDDGRQALVYALGDTHNDTAMLAAADVAMLVQRPGGTWDDLDVGNLTLIDGVGPAGWARAADMILAAADAAAS